jgi:hypothetical protein
MVAHWLDYEPRDRRPDPVETPREIPPAHIPRAQRLDKNPTAGIIAFTVALLSIPWFFITASTLFFSGPDYLWPVVFLPIPIALVFGCYSLWGAKTGQTNFLAKITVAFYLIALALVITRLVFAR